MKDKSPVHVTVDSEGVYISGEGLATFKITPEGQVFRDGKPMTIITPYSNDNCGGGCVNPKHWCSCKKRSIADKFNVEENTKLKDELSHQVELTNKYRKRYFEVIKELKDQAKEMDTLKLFKNLIKRLIKDA